MQLEYRSSEKELYICHTLIHIVRACASHAMSGQKGDIILSDSLKDCEELKHKLEECGLWDNVILFKDAYIEQKYYYFIRKESLRNNINVFRFFVRIYSGISLRQYKDIYIFNDMMFVGKYIRASKRKYHLIEDGIDVFADDPIKIGEVSDLDESVYGTCNSLKYVLDVEVNSIKRLLSNIPAVIKERQFVDLFKELPNEVMDKIQEIFIEKEECYELKKLFENGKEKALIITQPLWEIKRDEEYFVGVYNDIAKLFVEKDFDVIIKAHPRDENRYQEGIRIKQVSNKFPIELLFIKYNVGNVKYMFACNSTVRNYFKDANSEVKVLEIPLDIFLSDDWNVDYVRRLIADI